MGKLPVRSTVDAGRGGWFPPNIAFERPCQGLTAEQSEAEERRGLTLRPIVQASSPEVSGNP